MYFKNSVIFLNEDLAEQHKEDRDEITRFFEHDEREEMSLKEKVIGHNKMDNFDDSLNYFMKDKSKERQEMFKEILEPRIQRVNAAE